MKLLEGWFGHLSSATFAAFVSIAGMPVATAETYCVDFRTEDNVSYLINRCSESIYVEWYDDTYCTGGCGLMVGRNGRQSIIAPGPGLVYAACPADEDIVDFTRGSSYFRCEDRRTVVR